MKRIFGQVLVLGVVAMGSLLLAPACTDNNQSLFIRNVQAPPTNRQNGSCVYTPDPAAPFISEGALDVAVTDSYSARFIVGSELIPRGDNTAPRAEPNRTVLQGVVVRVTDPGDTVTYGEFTAVSSGPVDPTSSNTPGFGILGATILDGATAQKASAGLKFRVPTDKRLVIANVKAFGKTLGGVDLESGEFQFPITLCNGCLLTFAGNNDPATPDLDCNLTNTQTTTSSSASTVVLPCIAGQDEVTSCITCTNRKACRGEIPVGTPAPLDQ